MLTIWLKCLKTLWKMSRAIQEVRRKSELVREIVTVTCTWHPTHPVPWWNGHPIISEWAFRIILWMCKQIRRLVVLFASLLIRGAQPTNYRNNDVIRLSNHKTSRLIKSKIYSHRESRILWCHTTHSYMYAKHEYNKVLAFTCFPVDCHWMV